MSKFPFTKNIVAIRSNTIVLNPGITAELCLGQEQVATISAELMQFGYILSPEAYEALSQCSAKYAMNWLEEIINYLRYMTGSSEYKPLHAGFPQTVASMSLYELYSKAITHYWSTGKWYPEDEVAKKYKFESIEFTVINRISEEEFKNVFKSIAQVGVPITEVDFEILKWFVEEYKSFNMPDSVPLKENLCVLAALGIDVPVKTSTDVLRIATYLSNGTTDLIMPPKKIRESAWSRTMVDNPEYIKARFKKFSRPERRYLLGLLDKVANSEEMVLRKERWLRLGEILHPGEGHHAVNYPRAFKAFNELRNTKVKSWYSKLDGAFNKSLTRGLQVLSERPGEFARRLDYLLRTYDNYTVLTAFEHVALRVSNKVLFELLDHFFGRLTRSNSRTVFIKGARRPVQLPILEPLIPEAVQRVETTIWNVLRSKFSLLEPMGKVWIDPKLDDIPIPSNMKTLTDSLKPKARGTRMPLKADKKVLRAFVHWTAGVDLDLSMEFCRKSDKISGNRKTTCSYHSLRPFKEVLHSGDVIPNYTGKHAEYIDININECTYDYGLITLRNFNGGSLSNLGAVLGFMEREFPESNTTWYPKTITDSYRLDTSASNINLAIIDFRTKEVILIDEDATGIPISNGEDILNYIDSYSQKPRVSVKDLLMMHVEHRGVLVKDTEEADQVFNFSDFCESYKTTLEYML